MNDTFILLEDGKIVTSFQTESAARKYARICVANRLCEHPDGITLDWSPGYASYRGRTYTVHCTSQWDDEQVQNMIDDWEPVI